MAKKKAAQFELHKGAAEIAMGEPPESFKGLEGLGKENIGPGDIVWMVPGADGELTVQLPEEGYEQYSPFDLLLMAIIDAHPRSGARTRADGVEHERLAKARAAIFGNRKSPSKKPGGGQKGPRKDETILLAVAKSVVAEIVRNRGKDVDLADLIRRKAAGAYGEDN